VIAYRMAGPDDAALLAALSTRAFTETFGHLYAPADLAAFLGRLDEASWAAELADPALAIRIVEDHGVAAGFAKLGPPAAAFTPPGPHAELRQLYVLAPWHGTGLADALMGWTIEAARARGAVALYLSVFIDNPRARRFYERHGFERVGSYIFMVGDQADEDDVMRLAL
jgi:ribosomal protein S18 acetylase RimI-like enzyme